MAGDLRQGPGAEVEAATLLGGVRAALGELSEDVAEHVAEVDRHDRGRGFVGAEAVVVGGAGDGSAEQVGVQIDRPHAGQQEDEELHVRVGFDVRVEQVHAGVGRDRPVVVLAGAVDAGEGLFVEEADEAVAFGDGAQHLHHEHLVIGGDVGALEDGGELVLVGGDLVVAGFDGHAELVEVPFDLGHEGHDAFGDGAEIVVVELVSLGGGGADERAAAEAQVLAAIMERAVDEEVLLLAADRGDDA